MGYHLRLAKIEKTMKSHCSGFKTYKQVMKRFMIEDFYDLPTYEELIYLGDVTVNEKENFFAFDIKKYGYDFHIISEKELENIIEQYYQHVRKYYNKLYDEVSKMAKDEPFNQGVIGSHMLSMRNNWCDDICNWRPYNLNRDKENIVSSDRYEYDVFELVRILKTFDFKNNYLILSGW